MNKLAEVIGQNIKSIRRKRGLIQEELAEVVGVTGSYLGYLERGQKAPSLELLEKLANALSVDPTDLLISTNEDSENEVQRLLILLKGKTPQHIKFLNEVAVAYFKSIDKPKT